MTHLPNVLLLGNGLNLSFDGLPWSELLEKVAVIEDKDTLERIISSSIPEPLKAIAVTEDRIDVQMKSHKKDLYGSVRETEHRLLLNRLLDLGFDHILTTNYSYELEKAALGIETITDYRLEKLQTFMKADNVRRAEGRYLLHTYMKVPNRNGYCPVWHIHGEARKPDSMILGHYYYGNQLCGIKKLLSGRADSYRARQSEGKDAEIKSWIDAFILGNVYVLGFGMDVSELDIWWLLNRKKREKAEHGGVFFYEPYDKKQFGKYQLLRQLQGKHSDLGWNKAGMKKEDYKAFYDDAIADIEERIKMEAER